MKFLLDFKFQEVAIFRLVKCRPNVRPSHKTPVSLVSFGCRVYNGTLECLPFYVDHLDADIRQFRHKPLPVLLVQLLGEPLDILVLGFKVNCRMSRLGFQYVYGDSGQKYRNYSGQSMQLAYNSL
jgi:hypothetical protein